MDDLDPITVTPVRVADLLAGDERMPVHVHLVDHAQGRVLVDTGLTALHPHPTVIAGDTAVWFGKLDEPQTEGQRLVRSLDPASVWLSHTDEPWRPHPSP